PAAARAPPAAAPAADGAEAHRSVAPRECAAPGDALPHAAARPSGPLPAGGAAVRSQPGEDEPPLSTPRRAGTPGLGRRRLALDQPRSGRDPPLRRPEHRRLATAGGGGGLGRDRSALSQ